MRDGRPERIGFLLLVAGPQELQQLVVIGPSTWPAAIALAGVLAYAGGSRELQAAWEMDCFGDLGYWVAGEFLLG